MVNISRLAHQQWSSTGRNPLFVFDNNSIQKYSKNANCNIIWSQRVKIPPHSPDFNKPIEHIFNRIKEQLREKYLERMEVIDAKTVQQWVREIFEKELLEGEWKDSVKNDVHSLKKTWLAVSLPKGVRKQAPDGTWVRGSGGGWPASHLR